MRTLPLTPLKRDRLQRIQNRRYQIGISPDWTDRDLADARLIEIHWANGSPFVEITEAGVQALHRGRHA